MIEKKIEQLFEFRKVPFMLSQIPDDDRCAFKKTLVDIQKRIYELDSYLENNWKLDPDQLKSLRQSIINSVSLAGYDNSQAEILVSDIDLYEKYEGLLRKAILPISLNPEYYYHIKTCDVRLIRHLIYNHESFEGLKSDNARFWKYFDMATEINDDITDMEEDLNSINGNAFLISLIERGEASSLENYSKLMMEIAKKNRQLLKSADAYRFLENDTTKILDETRSLMMKKLESWNKTQKHIITKLYMYI